MKKIFSMFIAIIIVFTMSPIFAIAEETSENNNLSKESTGFEAYKTTEHTFFKTVNTSVTTSSAIYVSKINEKGYETLQEAFNEVEEGQTIQLLSDIELTDGIIIAEGSNKSFELDLNSKTLDGKSNSAIIHKGTGTFTIKGSGTIQNNNATNYSIGTVNNESSGSIIISDGIIQNNGTGDSNYATVIYNQGLGTIIVSGGTVQSDGTGSKYNHTKGIHNHSAGTIKVSGGTVQNNGIGGSYNYAIGIYNQGIGTIEVSDGIVSGKTAISNNSNGFVNISGGTIKAEVHDGRAIYTNGGGNISISGDAYISSNNVDSNDGTISLWFSTYSNDTKLKITGGTIENPTGNAIRKRGNSGGEIISDISIPEGSTAIIQGGGSAINFIPTQMRATITSSNNYDGSTPDTFNAEDILNYKYIKFDPSPKLTGTASLSNSAPRIGDTINADFTDDNNTGELSYLWKANGTNVETGTSYTVTAADFGKVITLEITSSVQIGTITNSTTEVRKILAPSAPGAPVLSSKTNSSVTLTANAAYEFSKDKISWQTSNVFNSLAANTAYTFYQRIAETSDTEASEAGIGLTVTTDSISGGGSNKGGGGSNVESPTETISTNVTVIPPTPKNPEAPTHGVIKIPIVGSNGDFTAKITDKTITEAFEKALADAKKNGKEKNGIGIILRVDADVKTGTNITVNLPKAVQDTIISNKIVNTIVVGDNSDISVGMDLATVQEINRQANSDVNITATFIDSSKLSDEAKKAIGNRLALDFKVRYGNGNLIKDFGKGSVEIEMPYTLGENENSENVRVVYIDDNGNIKWLENSRYDSTKKVVRFNTNHFSTYGIGYKQKVTEFTAIESQFADIESHWAKKDIEFVVNRGLLGGTSANTFSPNITMTRGMFVTSLGRLANVDTSNYKNSSFNDVKNDAYYMGYIEWASKNKIINGVSSGKFAPNQPITREQMATIMQNYAKTIDVKMPNNLFETKGIATRAEVSAILNRFMELINSSK